MEREPHVLVVGYASSCEPRNSSGFNAKPCREANIRQPGSMRTPKAIGVASWRHWPASPRPIEGNPCQILDKRESHW
jgi:hypothetical protein